MTTLTKSQRKKYGPRSDAKLVADYGDGAQIWAEVRHDDECRNGHNTFAVTGDIRQGGRWQAGGCLHDDIARLFPELADAIRYHLMSADEPLHYIENTMYWLGFRGWTDGKRDSPPNLEHARSTAVWPNMPAEYIAPSELPYEAGECFGLMDLRSKRERLKTLGAPMEAALLARKAGLMAQFRACVESLGFVY